MARASFLLPVVFVGCPYSRPFDFSGFRKTLERLPFAWYYADTQLVSKHLLPVLTTYINAVDFCIFDLSYWSPNVALELGMAEGLGNDYYILVNHNQSSDVPSDIKGLQRIEYSSVKGFESDDLLPSIARYLVKEETHPRHIWESLSGENRDKKFYLAMAILAHFRDNTRFSHEDMSRLSRGLYLRKEVQNEVTQILEDRGLISAVGSRLGARLAKRLYPPPLRLR